MMYSPRAAHRWLLLLVGFFVIEQATAQLNLQSKLPVDAKVKIGKLANGLTYYIRENKKPEQKVELRLVVNAGSILEEEDQQGLAHMAEHMAFNGTTHFKKNEIVGFLQDIGVGFGNDLNAYTGFDETVYILPIPTDKPGNLEKGFQVLEDWAHNVTYLDEDINGERPIILEESRLGKGANDRIFRKVYPHLFEGSKYARRLPIGIDSIIKNFPVNNIRRFYKDWYRPDLMAVIVVGDIDPAKAEEMVKKHFAGLTNPASESKREYADVPPYNASQAMVVTDKEATGYRVSINYPAIKKPAVVTLGDYRKELIEQMFVSMLNDRLQELAKKGDPPFIYGGADFDSYARGYESFNAMAAAGTGDVKKALRALAEEIERVKRYGFTASELQRAKKKVLAQYERTYNNRTKTESADLVEEYMNNFLTKEPIPGIEKEYEYVKAMLPAITLHEVNDVSNKLKDQKNLFVYMSGPETDTAALPTDKDLLAIIDAEAHAAIKPYEEKAVASSLMSKTPTPGKVVNITRNAVLGTTEYTLSNGVTVTLKPTDFKSDQIIMGAVRPGGKNEYGLADKYNAEYMVAVTTAMGMGSFSPADLSKALAGKTVEVHPVFTAISDGFRGGSSVKDLETLFQLTYLHCTAPRGDTALFRAFIQKNKLQYANISANPRAAFADTLYKTLFDNNPLAPVVVPNSEFFDKISYDRVLAIDHEHFGDMSGMHFVFTGSFKEADIKPFIEKYIASLPVTGKKFSFIDNKVRPVDGKKTFTVNKGKEEQSLILGFYMGEIPFSEETEMKVHALSEVLNIRIIEELREKIQGIYGGGTYAELEKYPYSNYSFVVQLPCGPQKVDTLVKALNNEFNELAAKGPDTTYLNKVKKQWLEQHKLNIKDNGVWAEKLLQYKIQGGDPDRFIHYEKYVNKLTPKDVQDVAKMVLAGNEFLAIQLPERVKNTAAEETKKGF
jgi:zinc protease